MKISNSVDFDALLQMKYFSFGIADNMSGIDPAIYNELETLRNIKLNLEAECNGLGNQLNSQNDEMNSLKMTLNQRNHEIEEMKSSLKGALDKSKKLSDNLASMEKKNSSSSGQFEVKNKNKIEMSLLDICETFFEIKAQIITYLIKLF